MRNIRVVLAQPPVMTVTSIMTSLKNSNEIPSSEFQRYTNLSPSKASMFPGDNPGLGILASVCRNHDLDVVIIDGYLINVSPEKISSLILSHDPDIIGIGCVEANTDAADELIFALYKKSPTLKIIMGGQYASFDPSRWLTHHPNVIAVVIGEGESIIAPLCRNLVRGNGLSDLLNCAFRSPTGEIIIGKPNFVKNLDLLPFAARDTIDLVLKNGYVPSLITSRGCSYGLCSFCSPAAFEKFIGGPIRRERSVESIMRELHVLKSDYSINRITFTDIDFIGGPKGRKRINSLVNYLISSKLKIEFMCDARASDIEYELFARLSEAGLRNVFVGVETSSSRFLEFARKGTNIKIAEHAVQILHDLNLNVVTGAIIFHPFATIETIRDDLDLFHRLGNFDLFKFTRELQLYHGTEMYKNNLYNKIETDIISKQKLMILKSAYTKYQANVLLMYVTARKIISTTDELDKLETNVNEIHYRFARECCDYLLNEDGHLQEKINSLIINSCQSLEKILFVNKEVI